MIEGPAGQLNPTLKEFLDQLGVSADQKASLSSLSAERQEAVLASLEVLVVAGQLRGELARVSAELKQEKEYRVCLNKELKKVQKCLIAERLINFKNEKQTNKVIALLKEEIAVLRRRKRLNNRDRETFALRREEHKERIRRRVSKHRFKRKYQELLARLADFRRATQTRSIVFLTGESDVRTMCGRIKTEAQKLGKQVASPWND